MSDSTYFDLDLDTSNWENEELYAPVSGVAYTHNNASSGFGRHINIDLGDGTFVLVAHMDEIFIENGTQVAAGQLIGYEGCTGSCNGDHVHLGLHEGSASEDAVSSLSIEAVYWVANASDRGSPELLRSADFECGLASAGDTRDGDFYASDLPVVRWHPDGTLVKSFDPAIQTKSGLMLGLGESLDEVRVTMWELRCAKVDLLTIGQYLKPANGLLDVESFAHPEVFADLEAYGRELGFSQVYAGPYVRSSYHAGETFARSYARSQ